MDSPNENVLSPFQDVHNPIPIFSTEESNSPDIFPISSIRDVNVSIRKRKQSKKGKYIFKSVKESIRDSTCINLRVCSLSERGLSLSTSFGFIILLGLFEMCP